MFLLTKRAKQFKQIVGLLLISSLVYSQIVFAVLRDPTRPEGYMVSKAGTPQAPMTLRVEAIIISPERRVAVINGQALVIGEIISDARLIAIEPDAVQLDGRSGKITLFLLDKQIKQVSPKSS